MISPVRHWLGKEIASELSVRNIINIVFRTENREANWYSNLHRRVGWVSGRRDYLQDEAAICDPGERV